MSILRAEQSRHHEVKCPREVFLRILVMKLGDINSSQESFSADVILHSKWREPALDSLSRDEMSQVDYSKIWKPKIRVDNLLNETKNDKTYFLEFTNKNDSIFQYTTMEEFWRHSLGNSQKGSKHPMNEEYAVVNCRWRLKGVFYENLELEEFPFDVQDLSFLVTSARPIDEVVFYEDPDTISFVQTKSFIKTQEWSLKPFLVVENSLVRDLVVPGKSLGEAYAVMKFKCTVERRYMYFIYNINVVLTCISLMSFIPFALNIRAASSRIQLSFVLLLTTLTFKTNVSSLLPKISYLTLIDKYILCCWSLQCLQSAWHGIMGGILHDLKHAVLMDKIALGIFLFLYAILKIIYTWKVIRKIKKKDTLVEERKRGSQRSEDREENMYNQ